MERFEGYYRQVDKGSQIKFYAAVANKLTKDGANQIPYRMIKELAIPDRPTAWSVIQISPESTELEMANKLADYFVRITDEFTPMQNAPPSTYD